MSSEESESGVCIIMCVILYILQFYSDLLSTDRQKKEALSEEITLGMWQRFCQVLSSVPASDNYYMSWLMRGNRGFNPANKPKFAPPYLTTAGFDKLKVNTAC